MVWPDLTWLGLAWLDLPVDLVWFGLPRFGSRIWLANGYGSRVNSRRGTSICLNWFWRYHCAFSLPVLAWLVKSICCLSVCLSFCLSAHMQSKPVGGDYCKPVVKSKNALVLLFLVTEIVVPLFWDVMGLYINLNVASNKSVFGDYAASGISSSSVSASIEDE